MAKARLTDDEIERIVGLLISWQGKLSWEMLTEQVGVMLKRPFTGKGWISRKTLRTAFSKPRTDFARRPDAVGLGDVSRTGHGTWSGRQAGGGDRRPESGEEPLPREVRDLAVQRSKQGPIRGRFEHAIAQGGNVIGVRRSEPQTVSSRSARGELREARKLRRGLQAAGLKLPSRAARWK